MDGHWSFIVRVPEKAVKGACFDRPFAVRRCFRMWNAIDTDAQDAGFDGKILPLVSVHMRRRTLWLEGAV